MSSSLSFLGAVTGIFVVVYDGQHALKFTLGRARSVAGPGVHFKWPILQAYRVEETKHTTLDLEPQVIQLKDDLVYEIDCKVVYQITNLWKAVIEIDDLVTGLRNRVVMAVQQVVRQHDRESVRDTERLSREILEELRPVEEQWGVVILQLGFSNISPSPATLEITQLELLAREKLGLYRELSREMSSEAAVALIAGAVISLDAEGPEGTHREQRERELEQAQRVAGVAGELETEDERTRKLEQEGDETSSGPERKEEEEE